MLKILNKLDLYEDDVVLFVLHDVLSGINKFSDTNKEIDFERNTRLYNDDSANKLIIEIDDYLDLENSSQKELEYYSSEVIKYLNSRLNINDDKDDTKKLFEDLLDYDDL